jgi:RNA polymerase sigma-70 factor (ECF subfamily)
MPDARVSTMTAVAKPADRENRSRNGPRSAEAVPSLEELVAGHQQRVTRLCYRLLGWREDVEDVVQDVFLAALRGLPKFRGQSRVSTWLTTIAVNTCRSCMRRRLLRFRWSTPVQRERTDRPGPPAERQLMDRERFARVRHAVRRLPPKYREVVVLRYLEEMSIAEVAEVLSVAPNAAEVRLTRARKRLREDLTGLLEP